MISKNKTGGKILIIDDNKELLDAFRIFLSSHFSQVQTENNPNRIPERLRKEDYDIILLDMNFKAGVNTGNEGLFWLHEILELDPEAVVVLLTAFGDVELAVRSIKEGATDFIQKSWDEDKILSTLIAAYQLRQSKKEISNLKSKQQHLRESLEQKTVCCTGESPAMQKVLATVHKVAATDANILILGESGTGKEVVAREIHRCSLRKGEIFVGIDLGSLAPTLFEGEMFGYVHGAFTDAREDKAGRIEIASGGTLFLDEIGNLTPELQVKLLSVIQQRKISRLGSAKTIPVDFRLVCATNMPLEKMVREGQFREDLYYRINTIQIDLPPLRDRSEDIPLLAKGFLQEFSDRYRKTGLKISKPAFEKLKFYRWPGNVRELQHVMEKAVILAEGKEIGPEGILFSNAVPKKDDLPQGFDLATHERFLITRALEHAAWNMSLAARDLGINRSTLYDKLKKYDIKPL